MSTNESRLQVVSDTRENVTLVAAQWDKIFNMPLIRDRSREIMDRTGEAATETRYTKKGVKNSRRENSSGNRW